MKQMEKTFNINLLNTISLNHTPRGCALGASLWLRTAERGEGTRRAFHYRGQPLMPLCSARQAAIDPGPGTVRPSSPVTALSQYRVPVPFNPLSPSTFPLPLTQSLQPPTHLCLAFWWRFQGEGVTDPYRDFSPQRPQRPPLLVRRLPPASLHLWGDAPAYRREGVSKVTF